MKALIFNSGIGHRMGDITKTHPKCMTTLLNHETIFGRQLRLLSECGIKDFVITTGPWPEQLKEVAKPFEKQGCHFEWVPNEKYNETNYIYSCYCAKDKLYGEELITLHGDLVFNKRLVEMILANPNPSTCLINKNIPQPPKDFKGRVIDGKLREVGVNIFDDDCFTFQPFYKLSIEDVKTWLDSIVDFIDNKKIDKVYAENAMNVVSDKMNIIPLSYEGYYINEIDDPNDYERVEHDIQSFDYKEQRILVSNQSKDGDLIVDLLAEFNIKKPLFVVDEYLMEKEPTKYVPTLIKKTNGIEFHGFQPNPLYEEVLAGIRLYENNYCDGIVTIGGGSAIDVAKAIKLLKPLEGYDVKAEHKYTDTKLIAVPTTAGTGSESTRYAVIYKDGEKQSLTDDLILPDVAILETRWLETLPVNQKKATVLDALCHAIESMWSVNATEFSQEYSTKAITMILADIDRYIAQDIDTYAHIQEAANIAGKAINITQTTAAHAMSYKLTSLFRIPHGRAVAVCLPYVWKKLIDMSVLNSITESAELALKKIDSAFGVNNHQEALDKFNVLMAKLEMKIDIKASEEQIDYLTSQVNPVRLKNFPADLGSEDIREMYKTILNGLS